MSVDVIRSPRDPDWSGTKRDITWILKPIMLEPAVEIVKQLLRDDAVEGARCGGLRNDCCDYQGAEHGQGC